jgi:DNA transformation protein
VLSDHETHLVERLSRAARGLSTRRMFGGVGIDAEGVFFALIAADVLYLKVDDASRPGYEARGMTPFQPFADKPSMRSYYELPPDVLDDARALRAWVEAALRAARDKANQRSTARARDSADRKMPARKRKLPGRKSTAPERKRAAD